MKRFEDEGAYKYNFYYLLHRGKQIEVNCKECGGHAVISKSDDRLVWACSNCYAQGAEEPSYRYDAKGSCVLCERWFNVQVTDEKRTPHQSAHVECPHCGKGNQALLYRRETHRGYYPEIREGRESIFGMELYFLDQVRGKHVWAVNREHLNYLIAYISADLRVKPANSPMKTASHAIPAYMKNAKNREQVVRTLTKLQYKTG
ncbi:DNA-directed RNA polymerase subunit M/transcription elongation factor TFIIS [Paenibacillus amylolyticus]|uniref:DNA-directed RNA polymerase subunit M/transcription elongation factor TFIIS n=1 Tax=Paenibacillus amylolyticus TaxID=1451 RepID=A0AAP5LLK4_PAEAM|nr:hypothetical protein [Paenibacillus amylolyticus]MDR6722015.1 DNA-directed RNA polymerase subunit M/transcription elongation factor TFIIS [Paenibacillus amylolyticus]